MCLWLDLCYGVLVGDVFICETLSLAYHLLSCLWGNELPRIQARFLNFLGFKFRSNFLGFIFQKGLDSGFKFQMGGILDSDLGLQGPSNLVTL